MSFFLAHYRCLCLLSSHVHGRRQRSQPDATVRIICERLCCVTFGFFALGSETFEFEAAATAVMAAVNAILPGSSTEIVLVGYSLGARLALYLSSQFGDRFQMVVSISGSPGIAGKVQCLLFACNTLWQNSECAAWGINCSACMGTFYQTCTHLSTKPARGQILDIYLMVSK